MYKILTKYVSQVANHNATHQRYKDYSISLSCCFLYFQAGADEAVIGKM